MTLSAPQVGWIGPRPTARQLSAFLFVGSVALLYAGIQPILLGALVDEHRLSARALGQTATMEFFTTGVGVGLAGALFPPDRLKMRGALAAAALVLVNLWATRQSGLAILIDRGAAGLCEGVIVWLTASLIARAASPARWAGIFLVTQGVLQFVLAATLPLTLMQRFGANGGFLALAAAALAALAAMVFLPERLVVLHLDETGARTRISRASIASLLSVFFVFAFFIGFFAYFGQLATQARLTPEAAGVAVALAIGVSILGSGAAAMAAQKLTYIVVAAPCVLICFITLGVLVTLPTGLVFCATSSRLRVCLGLFHALPDPFGDPDRSHAPDGGSGAGRAGRRRRRRASTLLVLRHRRRRSRCLRRLSRLSPSRLPDRSGPDPAAGGFPPSPRPRRRFDVGGRRRQPPLRSALRQDEAEQGVGEEVRLLHIGEMGRRQHIQASAGDRGRQSPPLL